MGMMMPQLPNDFPSILLYLINYMTFASQDCEYLQALLPFPLRSSPLLGILHPFFLSLLSLMPICLLQSFIFPSTYHFSFKVQHKIYVSKGDWSKKNGVKKIC